VLSKWASFDDVLTAVERACRDAHCVTGYA
jgi:hypothetical protein